MNGGAMDPQDQVVRSRHKNTSGLQSPGYHLQINRPRHQNCHPQHSKAMNYQSLSDHCKVDGSSVYLHPNDKYSSVDAAARTTGGDVGDPRSRVTLAHSRQPLELPIPHFVVDDNFVGDLPDSKADCNSIGAKDLDLDTRIDLLIKSKALAGMHPIFSQLEESAESSYESDESYTNRPKTNRTKKRFLPSPPKEEPSCFVSFDDPEKPLSRPPSPFLSRATYLFWFNKAIELKQQAKAQEQALLEKAAKKLLQENTAVVKVNHEEKNNRDNPVLKTLLAEISKEVKEMIKQEFIKEVLDSSAFSALDMWWEKERDTGLENNQALSNSCELVLNDSNDSKYIGYKPDKVNDVSFGSTSPTMPYPCSDQTPLGEDLKHEYKIRDESSLLSPDHPQNELDDNQTPDTNGPVADKEQNVVYSHESSSLSKESEMHNKCPNSLDESSEHNSVLQFDDSKLVLNVSNGCRSSKNISIFQSGDENSNKNDLLLINTNENDDNRNTSDVSEQSVETTQTDSCQEVRTQYSINEKTEENNFKSNMIDLDIKNCSDEKHEYVVDQENKIMNTDIAKPLDTAVSDDNVVCTKLSESDVGTRAPIVSNEVSQEISNFEESEFLKMKLEVTKNVHEKGVISSPKETESDESFKVKELVEDSDKNLLLAEVQ